MRRRWMVVAGVCVLGAGAVCCLGLALAPALVDDPSPEAGKELVRAGEPSLVGDPELRADKPEPASDFPEPTHPGEEALFAATHFSGEGMVRCTLPPGTPALDLSPLNWAVREGDVVTLACETPFGLRRALPLERPELRLRADSVAQLMADQAAYEAAMDAWEAEGVVFAWSEAHPGTQGHCDAFLWADEERVPFEVVLTAEDGGPVGNPWISCVPLDAPNPVGHRASCFGARGRPMYVRAGADHATGFVQGDAYVAALAENDVVEIPLALPPPQGDPAAGVAAYLEPLELALEEELDPAAEAQIRAWMRRPEEWAADRADLDALLDEADARLEEVDALLDNLP